MKKLFKRKSWEIYLKKSWKLIWKFFSLLKSFQTFQEVFAFQRQENIQQRRNWKSFSFCAVSLASFLINFFERWFITIGFSWRGIPRLAGSEHRVFKCYTHFWVSWKRFTVWKLYWKWLLSKIDAVLGSLQFDILCSRNFQLTIFTHALTYSAFWTVHGQG